MKCGLEAQKLGLDANEQSILESEIDSGIKNNEKLQSLIKENKVAQEQLSSLRIEKREKALADKGTIESYQEAIDSQKDILNKEELKQLKEDNKQRRAERSEKIQDYNKSIRALMDAKKSLFEKQKELKGFIKDTQSNMVKKYIRGNADGVRKSLVLQQIADGKLSLKDIFDPAYQTPNSLMSIKQRLKNTIGDNTRDLVENALKNPNDYNDAGVKALHDNLITKINNEAKRLGVLEKHGLEDNQRPFAENYDVTRNLLFTRGKFANTKESFGKKPILSEDGLQEYKNDWLNAIGEDEINRLIEEKYTDKTIKPTIDEAFDNIRNDLVKGNISPIRFNNPKFVSDEMYNYMINKYSDKNIVQNLISFSNRKVNDLALSEATGGRLTDSQFAVDRNINDKQRNYYKNILNEGYGNQIGTSATRYARYKLLNSYGKLVVATRPLTMYLSPIGDRAIGASLTNMERDHFTLATLPQEAIRGIGDTFNSIKRIFRQGEAKEVLNDSYELFKAYADASNQRYDIESSNLGEGNLFSKSTNYLARATINHFNIQDNALRVVNAKDFSIYVNKHSHIPFDKLPTSYKDILTNQHKITSDDWEQIKKVAKDNDIITSEKFNGILANKIASIEVTSNLRAMPNEFPLAPGISSWVKSMPGGDAIHKALTMFWAFSIRTSVYGFKNAYSTKGTLGIVNYATRLMARGFVPNMILSGMFTLARTGDVNQTLDNMESPEGVGEALLGTLSRPLMALASLAGSPSDVGYKLSTPIIRDSWNMVHAIKSGGKAVIDGDDRKAGAIVLNEFLNLGVPGFAQTPLKSQMKEYIKNM